MTGDRPETLAGLVSRALVSCHDASLHLHLDTRPTPWCSGFGRMLDAAATREDVRRNPHLTRHLGECPGCTTALRGLMALRETPRSVLAEAVLGSAPGAAYAVTATVPGDGAPSPRRPPAVAAEPGRTGSRYDRWDAESRGPVRDRSGHRPARGRRTGDRDPSGRDSVGRRRPGTWGDALRHRCHTGPGRVLRGSTSFRLRPTLTDPLPSASVAPGGSPAGPPTSPAPQATASPDAPTTPLRASAFVPAVNSDTGLCLDVRGGVFANGTDVITTTCRDGSATQRWRLDDDGLLRNGARTDYCLDSRGPKTGTSASGRAPPMRAGTGRTWSSPSTRPAASGLVSHRTSPSPRPARPVRSRVYAPRTAARTSTGTSRPTSPAGTARPRAAPRPPPPAPATPVGGARTALGNGVVSKGNPPFTLLTFGGNGDSLCRIKCVCVRF